jgi:predicted dehydrogenase
LHIRTLKSALTLNVPVFVEKPLADSVDQLEEIHPEDRMRVMVGFCLRFHKIIRLVKEFLDAGNLGKISKARLYCGQYLPLWHPYTDYRNEYFSRKELGGGVLRTLSHELDLTRYLFGEMEELTGFSGKISDLQIDVEDTAFFFGRTVRGITTSVELDYLNPLFKREGVIIGSGGSLTYSFNPLALVFSDSDGAIRHVLNKDIQMDVNTFNHDMYLEQMKNFLNFVRGTEKPMSGFADGAYVMRIIKAIEDSTRLKSWQKLSGDNQYGFL